MAAADHLGEWSPSTEPECERGGRTGEPSEDGCWWNSGRSSWAMLVTAPSPRYIGIGP